MAIHKLDLLGAKATQETELTQHICAADVSQSNVAWSVTRRTLTTGLSSGVEIIEVNNGRVSFTVIPTRGMGLWRAVADNQTLGWKSPIRGPVHPVYVPVSEPSGLGWLCGFDELMCRCGMVNNGAPEFDDSGKLAYPIHGRIANLPAHEVTATIDDSAGTISIIGVVEETRFHFEKLRLHVEYITDFESSSITWQDRVENFGGTPTDIQMLYHTNIGLPTLNEGSQLVAPTRTVKKWNGNPAEVDPASWPEYRAPQAGRAQECYYLDLLADANGATRVLLQDAQRTAAVGLRFNTNELPCFTQWKNEVSENDGYVTGIEPALNFPNQRSHEIEHGRCKHLAAGDDWQASLTLDWHLDTASVQQAANAIQELQGDLVPEIIE